MLGQMLLPLEPAGTKLKHRIDIQIAAPEDGNSILKTHHYLRRIRTGRQLHYHVILDHKIDGIIVFAEPAAPNTIAGTPPANIIEFARLFLATNLKNEASCAIGKALRRVARDWANQYPQSEPKTLIVSYSDRTIHTGTIYRAANFTYDGITKDHRSGDSRRGMETTRAKAKRLRHRDYAHRKDRWLYHLRQ